ncbi:hypothetical protein Syun_004170 [Stephania yunnanensis]|uniref:Uncharacterized protein n=1 Tax=Stephania yunnanensis TaxID=152371 RepID=A0AAP0Q0Y0_9MAGN
MTWARKQGRPSSMPWATMPRTELKPLPNLIDEILEREIEPSRNGEEDTTRASAKKKRKRAMTKGEKERESERKRQSGDRKAREKAKREEKRAVTGEKKAKQKRRRKKKSERKKAKQ